jgi:hypothetical protein
MSYTLQEYWDMLDRHDWYYAFSDDMKVYGHGSKESHKILTIAEAGGEEYLEMLGQFQKHFFSGQPWDTEKAPKPERPVHEYE